MSVGVRYVNQPIRMIRHVVVSSTTMTQAVNILRARDTVCGDTTLTLSVQ